MAPAKKRLGEPGDFPGMAVYERAGPKGPIYSIEFRNREFGTVRDFLFRLIGVSLLSLLFPLLVAFGMAAEALGVNWLIGIAAYFVLIALIGRPAYRGAMVRRAIELDMGEDRLRVLKKGRVEIDRPGARSVNLTVARHPAAEFELRLRQEAGNKTVSDVEKQHCLLGWFGPGGGEQVMLLCRAEWPNRDSLFEVRQAILWLRQQVGMPETPELVRREGLRPPLD
jgi:hypothetical protein